jgi:alpha-glucosidase
VKKGDSLVDQVYSHTSDEHPWFTESRSSRTNARADWYVWAGNPPRHNRSPSSAR